MIPPRAPAPYSSARASSALPMPVDWRSGRTTSSERPQRPSRSSASAAPVSPRGVLRRPSSRPGRWRGCGAGARGRPPGRAVGAAARAAAARDRRTPRSRAHGRRDVLVAHRAQIRHRSHDRPAPAPAGSLLAAVGVAAGVAVAVAVGGVREDGRNRRDRRDRRSRPAGPGSATGATAGFGAFSRSLGAGARRRRGLVGLLDPGSRSFASRSAARRLRLLSGTARRRGARARARSGLGRLLPAFRLGPGGALVRAVGPLLRPLAAVGALLGAALRRARRSDGRCSRLPTAAGPRRPALAGSAGLPVGVPADARRRPAPAAPRGAAGSAASTALTPAAPPPASAATRAPSRSAPRRRP